MLGFYSEIDEPYNYIKMTPSLFNKWMHWARNYKPKDENVFREFGSKIGPDWARTEFKDLDDFYLYYVELIGE